MRDVTVTDGVDAGIRPTTVLCNILYACAHGRLPWGAEWDPFVTLCDGFGLEPPRYILCCGHSLSMARAAQLVGAGLLLPGPLHDGRRTLTVTKAGRAYLAAHLDKVEFDA